MSQLNEQQAAFVREYVSNGGNGAAAARDAGYSEVSAGKYAYQLLEKPHVQDAIHREQRRVLSGPLASMALRVLKGFLDDENAPYGVRADAAKAVLDRGGLGPVKAEPDKADESSDLEDLSIAQLEQLVKRNREILDRLDDDNRDELATATG